MTNLKSASTLVMYYIRVGLLRPEIVSLMPPPTSAQRSTRSWWFYYYYDSIQLCGLLPGIPLE